MIKLFKLFKSITLAQNFLSLQYKMQQFSFEGGLIISAKTFPATSLTVNLAIKISICFV